MYEGRQIERLLEKLKRLEEMVRERMFVNVDKVDMDVWPTQDVIHELPERELFRPCAKGTEWHQEGLYCWFRGTYEVPEELAGKELYIFPKIKGYEGFLWVNGRPYGNFASKEVVGSHGNHYCDLLVKSAAPKEKIDIALEYYAHHHVIGVDAFEDVKEDYLIQYNDVDICLKDELMCDFFYDLRIANQMVKALPKDDFRKSDVLKTLIEIHRLVDYDIDLADRDEWRASVEEADQLLQGILKDQNSPHVGYAGLIGHSHMDTAWLWHVDETKKKCARTYANQLSLMDQYPEYTFVQSSALHTAWMERYYPEIFEGIKQRVAEGRYEPNGGVWVECDCNIPNGEYMVRQFLWGQKYTQSRFGYKSDCFWLPDTFGYSASLPQIMKGCGVDYFLTTKLSWNDTNQFPYDTFYWEGIDNTKVFVHTNRTHVWPDPRTLLFCVDDTEKDGIKDKAVTNKRLISYGAGDGGGGPEFEMIEIANRLKDVEGLPRTEHTTVSKFMKKLEAESFRPSVYNGELYLELHRGTLTNQHQIKRNNRLAEIALHDLEYFTVLDALDKKVPISAEKVNPLTETLLMNQFHDILPGTCITRAHKESLEQTSYLIEEAQKQIHALAEKDKDQNYITAYNTLSFDRDDIVYLPLKDAYVKGVELQQMTEDIDGNACLAVAGVTIPAFGSKALEVEADTAAYEVKESPFNFQNTVLDTPFYHVVFDENGYISSLVDAETGRELKGAGYNLNTFLVAEDVPYAWDNWDMDADIADKWRDCAQLLERKVVSNGAVELRIRSTYQLTKRSTLCQDMVFYSTDKKIVFFTKMNWQDDHRFLKTAFNTTIQSKVARSEIQFGYIERVTNRNTIIEKSKFEVTNHKYTDLSEPGYGAAILNDCKYGISVEGSDMWLSLHKGGNRPDYTGDKGIHDCAYAFLPHAEGFSANAVVHPAYTFNVKPIIVSGNQERDSFMKVEAPNVIVETVKPMEEENGYVVRLYEAEGTWTKTKLSLEEKGAQVVLTNMLEEELEVLDAEDNITLEFKPFEIKTICVRS